MPTLWTKRKGGHGEGHQEAASKELEEFVHLQRKRMETLKQNLQCEHYGKFPKCFEPSRH